MTGVLEKARCQVLPVAYWPGSDAGFQSQSGGLAAAGRVMRYLSWFCYLESS